MRYIALSVLPVIVALAGCDKREQTAGEQIMADVDRSIKNEKAWQEEYKKYTFPTAKYKPAVIEYKYSEFDNQSTFSTDFFDFADDALIMIFTVDGKDQVNVKPPAEVSVAFDKKLVFDFRFKADGQEITVRKQYGGMFKLHTRDLLKIVQADRVLVKVDADEFVMRESEKRMFYYLLSVMGN